MDPIKLITSIAQLRLFDYIRELVGPEPWLETVLDVAGILIVSTFNLLIVIFLIWLERKVIARMQDRVGPNRVGGKYGALQTVADVVKLLSKEDIRPYGADSWAYNAAPFLTVMTALFMWAVIPFAPGVIGVDLNIGLFFVLAVSSVSVVSLLLAGWGSNNKYALLGAFRSVAQLVSYEVPMVIALLIPIILASSMSTVDIIDAQAIPFIILAPLSALIFFISALAETGRQPFDLLDAESEIVAGFHVEYGGMKFGMFFLAEFISTLFMSAMFTTVYLGGYRFLGLEALPGWGRLLGMIVFFVKLFLVYFVFIWIRGTLPRVRIDQLLGFNWKFLVPMTLLLLLVVALLEKTIAGTLPIFPRAMVHLFSNVLIGYFTILLLRKNARKQKTNQDALLSQRRREAGLPALHPDTPEIDNLVHAAAH